MLASNLAVKLHTRAHTVRYGEFNKYVRVTRPSRAEVLAFLRTFDKEHDGFLDRGEFRAVVRAVRASTT